GVMRVVLLVLHAPALLVEELAEGGRQRHRVFVMDDHLRADDGDARAVVAGVLGPVVPAAAVLRPAETVFAAERRQRRIVARRVVVLARVAPGGVRGGHRRQPGGDLARDLVGGRVADDGVAAAVVRGIGRPEPALPP